MASDAKEFDFIIIGGGTSGLVVAARISEEPSMQVLVLEAGENHLDNPQVRVPALWESLIGSDLDWKLATAPQNQLNGRVIGYPQGRVLGGTSALNAEAFIAPSEAGINYWGDSGNPGWDWKTMLPYYEKCYTLMVPSDEVCTHLGLEYLIGKKDKRGTGPIQASYTGTRENSLGKAWTDTFRTLNYGLKVDPFSGENVGGFVNPTTVDPVSKERSYSASAYFSPIQSRPNLHLMTGCQVEKITLNKTGGLVAANGVVIIKGGTRQMFTCKREVILAAGTLNSPKILELSGIGNKDILQPQGIDVVIENPNVGENLQDHPMTGISFEVNDGIETLDDLVRQDPKAIEAAMKAYHINKSGPFSGASINCFAFMPVVQFQSFEGKLALNRLLETKSSRQIKAGRIAEEEFVRSVISSANKSSAVYFTFAAQANFGAEANKTKEKPKEADKGNYITLCALLSYPLSRGSVHIRSASMVDQPIVDPKFLDHPMDLEVLANHLLFLISLSTTEPFASILKSHGRQKPDLAPNGNDLEAAKDYLGRTVTAGWHPIGTCRMGPRDQYGVVNERLIVHGSTNLRVVDASIMPLITRGNTQSTVYAVAERAADLIKEDHGS